GAVVALTKSDLVDAATLHERVGAVRARLARTPLDRAPVIACSAVTGAGLDATRVALDAMVAAAATPHLEGRPRHFVDRVFTIRGSGTVVTGTLVGGRLRVGDEAEILPSRRRARIRALQTHKRAIEHAMPVSRVAVNVTGISRPELGRGDVLCLPGEWRPTDVFDGVLLPVRALTHALTPRGAYKLYAGSAERDVDVRFEPGVRELAPSTEAVLVRITARRPVVLDLGDHFVLREAGRQETVAGGAVLDVDPPRRWDDRHTDLLRQRMAAGADRARLAGLLVLERGFVPARDVFVLTGAKAEQAIPEPVRVGQWVAAPVVVDDVAGRLTEQLTRLHRDHPLRPGLDAAEARASLAESHPALADAALADAVIGHLEIAGAIARAREFVRLPGHRASTAGDPDADRLVDVVGSAEPAAPTVKELLRAGFSRELIEATCEDGRLVKVSPDLLATPDLLVKAEAVLRAAPMGITVSDFRQALGTSRKYALPLLEHFDARGVTRREGDVRVVRT
ncbi:MAG: SelB C-terminal domain-containing protein, partial [Actinomycetota bacterium]